MVITEGLKLLEQALDGKFMGGSSDGSQVMVVGNTLQKHLLTVEFEAKGLGIFNRANAKSLGHFINHPAFAIGQGDHSCVEMRIFTRPQMWLGYRKGQVGFHR
ncbi:MAG: hypothetical protein BWY72_00977 [Bacteroidetes bacterium ADurb.Bin416]|nr:MAG: hypothetical protein BWY72_00977 [Bacteroidetes bacterium ADurb.Bin416]